jgi:PmbA protein
VEEELLDVARRLLARAEAGWEVEAFVAQRVVTTVQAETGGGIRHVGSADTRGVGVRAVQGDQVGYASTSDITSDGLDTVVARAKANAQVSDADPAGAELPSPATAEPLDGLCLPAMTGLRLEEKLRLVTGLARRVTSLDGRVRRLDTAQWRDEHRRIAVASTRGVMSWHETAFAELWCDALATDEDGEGSDFGYWWGRDPGTVDVESLAREAVTRTVRLLGPQVSASAATVVLDPEVAGLLLDAVGRSLTGGALGNRRSPFADRAGERVAAGFVRLADDGACPAGPGGAPVDDEGVPRRRTQLIQDGVLVGALHSTATAASVGAPSSTGNARRTNYKSAPRAAATMLRLGSTGDGKPVDGDAAYIQQVSGSVGVSSVTGRVSVGGVGFLMRDGEPAGRLPTVPIATSLQSLLNELVAVCSDGRVIADLPVLAPTLVWRPPKPLAW